MPRRPTRRSLAALATVTILASATACGGESDGDWEAKFWWGAHVKPLDGETRRTAVERFETELGQTMNAARVYRRWEDKFPTDDFRWMGKQRRLVVLSIKPIRADGSHIPWADIATAQPGTQVYDELIDWAGRIKDFGRPTYVVLHHEPEGVDDQASGTSQDYVAAWKRFAEIIRADAGSKAKLMWIMTDASFGPDAEDWQQASLWYPGDESVDAIGVDAFNWFTCRGRDEPWRSLQELADPARQFAAAHPDKEFWITEFGTIGDVADSARRQAWITDAATLATQPGWEQLHGVLHFDDVLVDKFPDCDWRLGGDPTSLTAFGTLGEVPRERPVPTTAATSTTDPTTSG
jgi:Glycosyl hydrolase family 26